MKRNYNETSYDVFLTERPDHPYVRNAFISDQGSLKGKPVVTVQIDSYMPLESLSDKALLAAKKTAKYVINTATKERDPTPTELIDAELLRRGAARKDADFFNPDTKEGEST